MARLSDRAAGAVGSVGEYLAEQRRHAQLSLRQLSDLAGVSNPYLSQIERGLRKPSADVLQQLAKALRISAETLYVRAGILDPDDERATAPGGRTGVVDAILLDPALNERQKRVLLDVYASFVRENDDPAEAAPAPGPAPKTAAAERPAKKPAAAKKTPARKSTTQ